MQKVLQKISPNKKEKEYFNKTTQDFMVKLNSKLDGADAILGGSGAKDTWLSNIHDVDIFVRYDYKKFSNKSDKLSQLVHKTLKKVFPKKKLLKLHGSRDYFQLEYKKLTFEVVPILKISKADKAVNITDISPLHAIWVNKQSKKLKNEIRLAKQFCKANKLYGAESYLAGFSGYGLEILVMYYQSFEKLLLVSQKWKSKEVLDPEKHYKNTKEVMFNLNSSKLQSPLIVVDPVDKNRNVAAALSREKFILFKELAYNYLNERKESYFVEKELDFKKLSKKKGNVIFINLLVPSGKPDVVGMKIVKSFNFVKKNLKKFQLKEADWHWDEKTKAKFYFLLGKDKLSTYEVRKGPPLEMKDHVKDFKKKYKQNFETDSRIVARVKVKRPKLNDYTEHLLKDKYLKDKIKKIVKFSCA
jgi:tRNA nucleotidyltransferase (CCA-adding enzyme)